MLNYFNIEFFNDSSFIVLLMLKCSLTKSKKLSQAAVFEVHVHPSVCRCNMSVYLCIAFLA